MLKWTRQQQHQQHQRHNFLSITPDLLDLREQHFIRRRRLEHLKGTAAAAAAAASSSSSSSSPSISIKARARKRYSTGNFIESPNEMPTITRTLERRRLYRRSLDNQLDVVVGRRNIAGAGGDGGVTTATAAAARPVNQRVRQSFTGIDNKENFGVHFVRSPFGNTSLIALQDLSNGKSPRRSEITAAAMRQQRPTTPLRTLTPTALNIKRGGDGHDEAANDGDVDEDDDADEHTPLSRIQFRNNTINNNTRDESLSSSRMGDITLDRMLDAIIESARKEVKPICCKHLEEETGGGSSNSGSETKHGSVRKRKGDKDNDGHDVDHDDLEHSIHEMEVRTPTHLKRQRVVRRKNPKTTNTAEMRTQKREQQKQQQQQQQSMIGLTLPNGIPSPDTPLFKHTTNELLAMSTPPEPPVTTPSALPSEIKQQNSAVPSQLAKPLAPTLYITQSSDYATDNLYCCSTPTLEEAQSIKRCLSFSSASGDDAGDDDDDDGIYYSAAKRFSVTSSNASYTSGRCSRTSQGSMRYVPIKGSLDLAIFVENSQLNVHVIRCRDLQRSNGSTALNAYVKVALIRKPKNVTGVNGKTATATETGFQRTAVHRHSSRPYFDHRFKFDLHRNLNRPFYSPSTSSSSSSSVSAAKDDVKPKSDKLDFDEYLQLAVWHRDRQLKRSEFLGCMSFPLESLLQQPINGSYKLQSQACLNNPQPPIPLQQQQQQQQPFSSVSVLSSSSSAYGCSSSSSASSASTSASASLPNTVHHNNQHTAAVLNANSITMATLARQKSDEDIISIDSLAPAPQAPQQQQQQQQQKTPSIGGIEQPPPPPPPPVVLSKKALHQRDADENLFLRFLELDPPSGTEAATGSSGSTTNAGVAVASSSSSRRLSNVGSKPFGRTPFTITKKLTRTAERGYGFSIVWTHPPRVEKVEPGLSADRCGIQPGDYVIFVDKHNVVTMPEADVLNLIRSQGSTLTLEIFRRSGSAGGGSVGGGAGVVPPALNVNVRGNANGAMMNGRTARVSSAASNYASDELQSIATTAALGVGIASGLAAAAASTTGRRTSALPTANVRPSTACSGTSSSIEAAKRRLHLPQVTFSKESIAPITDNRRRILLQLISREQNFISALHFGMERFVQPLQERKDLISPNDHRTLFQNADELLRIAEDILEQLCNDDQEPHMNFVSRVYLSKTTALCAAYKKYCNGIKRADCVLVNKSRQAGSEFVAFITEPQVPRRRPDLTMFIHRPLQHFREILKLMQLLASNCHVDTEEHKNFTTVINELQAAYREITMTSGLMEPLGEGRPLLTLQDLEARMVFTKCKPFTLAVQGRQWIFGGDLSRIDGRSVKPYWTLLFSDIIVFAKVSRDRVLFITEEPIPIANIVDSCFHMRKKTTEFRLTVDPNGRFAESPTGYCAPDLSRTPKKGGRRKSLLLRAPSLELKAVWQNLLQRQIFLVNAALGSTPLSSPLDSPDVLNTLVPLSDIGIASASIGSIKLSSMDSINLRNQQQNKRNSNASDQIDMLIDEKCRILNKTGTPKSSALHLANWMKGQLDKQQEQARLAATAAQSHEHVTGHTDGEHLQYTESDHDERITYWTRQQLEKRTKELNLAKENGNMKAHANFGGKRLSGVEELSMSDAYSEGLSQISKSHSTTSDSQITVRSSPVVLDKLAVCRHCHKNCQQQQQHSFAANPSEDYKIKESHIQEQESSHQKHSPLASPIQTAGLICNSLKVQHSQSSPNRCCRLNNGGSTSRAGSITSISSSTITGDQPTSERSTSKVVASSSRRETGDTESDVAQLLTDDLPSQSEATTDDSVVGLPSSSTERTEENRNRLTDSISKLRILDEWEEARVLNGHITMETTTTTTTTGAAMMNGHCSSSGSIDVDSAAAATEKFPKESKDARKYMAMPQIATESLNEPAKINENVKTTITITEMAKIVRITIDDDKQTKEEKESQTEEKSPTTAAIKSSGTKSPKSPHTPQTSKSPQLTHPAKFMPCHCKCTPADFENTTLSPDEIEQQTCKLIESPKQSPKMPKGQTDKAEAHTQCKCICSTKAMARSSTTTEASEDEELSLMLFGLAQFTPTTQILGMRTKTAPMPAPRTLMEENFVPTIAVVPPTPEAILTKTSTNVWDNTSSPSPVNVTTSTATKVHISNVPKQAIIENIPEDSCDESPLDEEPPYRPMTNTLRRYGTMSSLEKLPSDERVEDEMEELTINDEDDDDDDDNDDDDDDDADDDDGDDEDDIDDNARADNVDDGEDEIRVITRAVYATTETRGSGEPNGSAWTTRAGSFVTGKMSFFEESRAFIDKYLGRWNQEQNATSSATTINTTTTTQPTSETEEQMDECTSGATSGEELWGTPTSGGDNDDGHINSENTQSSPTKSSNSLNDDDDTELMMDELLMAPPMTASTIRGLLPRRRLEPLFEEDTESEEEKTQEDSENVKKGETTTNGHYLEDSAGSSSDEDPPNGIMNYNRKLDGKQNENEEEMEEEDEPTSTEERLDPNLQTMGMMGPRPLRNAGSNPPKIQQQQQLPLMKASSCEYLLEQHSVVASQIDSNCKNSLPAMIMPITTTTTMTMTTTPMMTMMMMNTITTMTTTKTSMSHLHSSISTTTNNVNVTTNRESSCYKTSKTSSPVTQTAGNVRPAKFIPPPPPPRRLLLTQTNLNNKSGMDTQQKMPQLQQNSGVSADDGSFADVDIVDRDVRASVNLESPEVKSTIPPAPMRMEKEKSAAFNITASAENIATSTTTTTTGKRAPSSTIIETSLLGSADHQKPISTSSITVLTKKPTPMKPQRLHQRLAQQQQQQQQEHQQPVSQPQDVQTIGKVTQMATEKNVKQKIGNNTEKNDDGDGEDDALKSDARLGCGLSPRLEMRLALNHDILGDEDLICYDPGPDLTAILGHDLSTFQRLTGRDLLNRSATNRVQPKEAVISFSQQRNSKMDTPTVNRRPRPASAIIQQQQPMPATTPTATTIIGLGGSARVGGVPQHLQPNRNTWSNSVYADQSDGASVRSAASNKSYSCSSDANKLSDLEILARREKIYCMSQLKSGSQARRTTTKSSTPITATTSPTTSMTVKGKDSLSIDQQTQAATTTTMCTTSMGVTPEHQETANVRENVRVRKIGRDETALMEMGMGNRLINFIKRRNSELSLAAAPNCSQSSLSDSTASSTPVHQRSMPMSPRKDNDKPSLNRRLWKQITKRRRSNSVTELVAS